MKTLSLPLGLGANLIGFTCLRYRVPRRLQLSINVSATRDELAACKLSDLSIPFTFVVGGGGGDSQESTLAMIEGIKKVSSLSIKNHNQKFHTNRE